MSERLALGTAQFGAAYGIANTLGQVGLEEVATILSFGRSAGMATLDTAIAYGNSEARLGAIGVSDWEVVTKLPPVPDGCDDVPHWVGESVRASMMRLGVSKLHGLLLHRSQDLLGSQGDVLQSSLLSLRDAGLVEKIGVSVYDPAELDALHPRFAPGLVQAPLNILDRRLATSGWLARLRENEVEVHTRSSFLQGLLLMDRRERPIAFRRWQSLWDRWDHWLMERQLAPLPVCLGFALSHPEVHRVVVGVDSCMQLDDIVASIAAPVETPPDDLLSHDRDLINPSRWVRQ